MLTKFIISDSSNHIDLHVPQAVPDCDCCRMTRGDKLKICRMYANAEYPVQASFIEEWDVTVLETEFILGYYKDMTSFAMMYEPESVRMYQELTVVFETHKLT